MKMKQILWIAFYITALVIIVSWMFWRDVASDRSYKLEVLTPIILLKNSPQSYPESNTETGKIHAGEQVEVLRMGYGKDFRAWHVKGEKGQEGWFIEDGKNVRVLSRTTQ